MSAVAAAAPPTAFSRGLLYSACWEDSEVARSALRIQPGATIVAIGAAGDNVLALLQDEPATILAVDANPAQTALIELKLAAIRGLHDTDRIRRFLGDGVRGTRRQSDRASTYRAARETLSEDARRYWDARPELIERGVIHAGRFERFIAGFRRVVLPLVPGRRTVRELLRASSIEQQRRTYRERWDSRAWRALFRVSFSRRLLARFGRDPSFFAQCELEDIGGHYLERARYALSELPIWSNPYLTFMLSGAYGSDVRAPDYLRPEVQDVVRSRLDRVAIRTAPLAAVLRELPAGTVDGFYLSDIFELATPAEHEETLREIARVGRPGARICYWNNLVPRRRPESMADLIASHPTEAAPLFARDRAFLYSAFVVEAVVGST